MRVGYCAFGDRAFEMGVGEVRAFDMSALEIRVLEARAHHERVPKDRRPAVAAASCDP